MSERIYTGGANINLAELPTQSPVPATPNLGLARFYSYAPIAFPTSGFATAPVPKEDAVSVDDTGGVSQIRTVTASHDNTGPINPFGSSDNYMAGMKVPAQGFRVGTIIRYRMLLAKAASGNNATLAWKVLVGPNGSTSDTAVLTLTHSKMSSTADTGWAEFTMVFRTVGAAATIQAVVVLASAVNNTFLVLQQQVLQGVTSSFDSTVATGNYVGLDFVNPGALNVTGITPWMEVLNL